MADRKYSEFLALLESKVRPNPGEKRCSGTGRKELTRETLREMGFTGQEIEDSLEILGGYVCDCHTVGLHSWSP